MAPETKFADLGADSLDTVLSSSEMLIFPHTETIQERAVKFLAHIFTSEVESCV